MIKKHHTIRYIIARTRQIYFQKKNPDAPWMTQESVKILDMLIKINDSGLEFGSGRSTAWFAKRSKNLISIEHNKKWYEIVKNKIKDLKNIEYRFYELSENAIDSDYYKTIYQFSDNSFDYIINDGKYRDLIALGTVNLLKIGGIYILDNAERYLPNNYRSYEDIIKTTQQQINWNKFLEKTANWRRIWTNDGISSTLIMIKNEK